MKTYLVGGAVRDQLLGIPFKDKDWMVVDSSITAMLEQGFTQVGKDFPVFLHPHTNEEYALARTERKTGHGYTGFECNTSPTVTLEDDLLRRDITINAMARDESGQIIDPYQGQQDLDKKILRHVSPAFSEDPLRILRVARFAARFHHLGFSIADETLSLMTNMVKNGEANHLVSERVWQECASALSEQSPWVFFEILKQTNCLKLYFGELDALFGVPQPEKHHPEIDCGKHALLSLQQACILSQSPEVRFSALIHDLGKALTEKDKWPSHHGHEQSGRTPIKQMCQRLRIPTTFKELALITCEFHTHIHRALELNEKTIVKVLKQCDAFRRPERFKNMLICCESDSKGRTGYENTPYPQSNHFIEALNLANTVKPKDLIVEGYKGKDVGIQIDLRRAQKIKQLANSPAL